jgi:hypothetical protein
MADADEFVDYDVLEESADAGAVKEVQKETKK